MLPEREPTGITGLDNMVEGGIPRGRVVLIVGSPGIGKTILCTQFLVNGINLYDENGIFISLEETKPHLYQAMKRFKWDLQKLETEGKFNYIDASPIRHAPGEVRVGKLVVGKRAFSMLSLINTIQSITNSTNAKRIVVDPLAALIYQYPEIHERRTAFLDLVEVLIGTGVTSLVTMESHSSGLEKESIEEEYLSHGSIVMQRMKIGKSLSRVIHVRKMRMTAADDQPRPYKIDETGINVYDKEALF